jgi:hypothetical protein
MCALPAKFGVETELLDGVGLSFCRKMVSELGTLLIEELTYPIPCLDASQ